MYYTIYQTTNNLNGKFYVGMHKTKNLDDGYVGSGTLLKRAIKKYGIENFVTKTLYVFDNEHHMKLAEKILVVSDPMSYNLCEGGMGGFGYLNKTGLNNKTQQTLSSKEKRVASKAKFLLTEDGKEENRRVGERMKILHQQGKIKYDTFSGKKHTPETIAKMKASQQARRQRALDMH